MKKKIKLFTRDIFNCFLCAVLSIVLFTSSSYSNEVNTNLLTPETPQIHHKKYIKILSIDGGGIRGIIPAIMLSEIESRTKQPISKTFDMIAGTSTGGIITLYLASPSTETEKHSAENLVKMYENDGNRIFKRSKSVFRNIPLLTSKYNSEGIESILKEKFGINSTFESINKANPNLKVIITSYDIINNRPCYFTNYADKFADDNYIINNNLKNLNLKSSSNEQIQFADINSNMKLFEIARATSAAPTVFNYYSYKENNNKLAAFIDGGMFANNPALVAYFEAKKLQKLGVLDPDAELLIVSLGTGSYPSK